jgi:hypothetical protein
MRPFFSTQTLKTPVISPVICAFWVAACARLCWKNGACYFCDQYIFTSIIHVWNDIVPVCPSLAKALHDLHVNIEWFLFMEPGASKPCASIFTFVTIFWPNMVVKPDVRLRWRITPRFRGITSQANKMVAMTGRLFDHVTMSPPEYRPSHTTTTSRARYVKLKLQNHCNKYGIDLGRWWQIGVGNII